MIEGQAVDSQGGGIFDDQAYTWSESGGTLGTGPWLVVDLKPGPHTITLSVHDRFGHTAHKSVQLVVR